VICDDRQIATGKPFELRRNAAYPSPTKPSSIIAQVDGSGTTPALTETAVTEKAFPSTELSADPALPAKSLWSLITLKDPIGLNIAEVEPGALRLRETPLLNTSDKLAVPVPVVVPAKVAKASVRLGAPETLKVNPTSAVLPAVAPVSAEKNNSRPDSVTPSTTVVKGLKSLRVTVPEPLTVGTAVMSENVTEPTLHEKPAASYTLTEALAHAAANAEDAPSNGDIPKSVPAASAAKAKHLRLPIRVSLIDRAVLIVDRCRFRFQPTTQTTLHAVRLFRGF
jgi:hypothetical protein